jgi:hypothetical protein
VIYTLKISNIRLDETERWEIDVFMEYKLSYFETPAIGRSQPENGMKHHRTRRRHGTFTMINCSSKTTVK